MSKDTVTRVKTAYRMGKLKKKKKSSPSIHQTRRKCVVYIRLNPQVISSLYVLMDCIDKSKEKRQCEPPLSI